MLIRLIFLYLSFCKICYTSGQFNMTAYKQMPPLYHFEDYDACLKYDNNSLKSAGTYCMVYAEIVPNATSTLWQQIDEFSDDRRKRHFRHDRLYFGVCLERCKALLQPLSAQRIGQLYGGKVQDTEIVDYYTAVHKRQTDDRIRYERLVGSCLNYEFQRSYQLSLRTGIEYCERSNAPLQHDTLDRTVYGIFIIIAILNITCTFIDYRLKLKQPLNKRQGNAFYKQKLESNAAGHLIVSVHKLLTSFSLCRNYYRLVLPSEGKMSDNLKFLNVFRAFGTFLVIFAHALMLFMAVQIANPEMFEKFLHRAESGLVENASVSIQIFFVMSGFLLYINFTESNFVTPKTSVRNCISVYIKLFSYRYLRLVPSLIILILFNATIFSRLQDGPFWRHVTEPERTFCREHWWQNIFFINNHFLEQSCSLQTWYLSADMQLFELYLITLILLAKYPKLFRPIFAVLLILAVAVLSVITYYFNLPAVYQSNPENYRYMFFKDAQAFYQAYTPFYTNLGGYLFGIASARLYLKSCNSENTQRFQGQWKYEFSWWLVFPVGFGLLFACSYVMAQEVESPSIWVALFAGVYRNLWVAMCAGAVLGMSYKLGWIAYKFSRLSVFHLLARISYQAFLWHVVILRLLGGFYRQPIYLNRLYLFSMVAVAFVFTNLVALLMSIVVEYPIAEVVKYLLKAFSKELQTGKVKRNETKELNDIRLQA